MNATKVLRAVALALAAWFVALLALRLRAPLRLSVRPRVDGRRHARPRAAPRRRPAALRAAVGRLHPLPLHARLPGASSPRSELFGLGYKLGRFVSLAGFFAVAVLGYIYARREGGSRAAAACAIAIIFGAFVPTGTFYDLARPDSLFMGLVTAGLLVGWWKRKSYGGGVAAALLLVAAFFVKQTAAPFMVVLGLVAAARLAARRRRLRRSRSRVVGLPALWLSQPRLRRLVLDLHQRAPSQARLLPGARVSRHARPPRAHPRPGDPARAVGARPPPHAGPRLRHASSPLAGIGAACTQLRHAVGVHQRVHARRHAAGHRHRRRRRPASSTTARRAAAPAPRRRLPPARAVDPDARPAACSPSPGA